MSYFRFRGVNYILIRYDDKILIQKRTDDAPVAPGEYCIPGGGIDPGESPDEAVVREIFEETQYRAKHFKFFCGFEYLFNGEKKVNLFYIIRVGNPKIVSSEGEMNWYSLEEAKSLNLANQEGELLDLIKLVI